MVFDSNLQRIGQTVGAKLRAARLARKYTQSQLAQPDFSVSYVSAIERGQIHPSLRALQIFAQRLGISSSDLLSEQKTVQALQGFSEKVAAHEKKEDIELQLLEAQLYIYQGNERQAVTLLRNLSSDDLTSEQEIRKRYLLGWAFYQLGFLQESESVLAEALALATDLDDFWLKHILNVLGMVHVSMRNYTQGFEYQQRNLDQLEKEQQPRDAFFEAQVYTNNGLYYIDLDKVDDAIEMFQRALAITKEFLLPDQLSSMYWDISRYLAQTQHYFLATLYGHKTLQLLFQEYSDSLRSEIYYYLGQAMLHEDQQKTLIYLERLSQDASLKKDTLALASVTATTADALFRQGEVKKAYEYAQKACKLASAYGDRMVTASIFLTFANIAYAQKDYQEGDAYFAAGLGILERLDNRKELADHSAIYAQLLEARGLPHEALRFYKKAYEYSQEHE
jgi:tetratricopeptide (TPR) repeat protein